MSTLEPPARTFLFRLHVWNFCTGILACIVNNVFINFSHISRRTFIFFLSLKLFFYHYFLVLRWWSNYLENFLENLHLAVDQHPVHPNGAKASALTSDMVPFGLNFVTISMMIDIGKYLHFRFDRFNWPLTSSSWNTSNGKRGCHAESLQSWCQLQKPGERASFGVECVCGCMGGLRGSIMGQAAIVRKFDNFQKAHWNFFHKDKLS